MKPGVEGLLDKARHSIHAAEVLLSQGEAEIAVGRAYYAMFYAAESPEVAESDLALAKARGRPGA